MSPIEYPTKPPTYSMHGDRLSTHDQDSLTLPDARELLMLPDENPTNPPTLISPDTPPDGIGESLSASPVKVFVTFPVL